MAALHRADRKSLLAKIHIAKDRLCLSDSEYRSLLRAHFGVDSAADLALPQMAMLLGHFDEIQISDHAPLAEQKRQALLKWKLLGRRKKSLDNLVRRLFGVSRLEWLTHERDVLFLTRQISRYEDQAHH